MLVKPIVDLAASAIVNDLALGLGDDRKLCIGSTGMAWAHIE